MAKQINYNKRTFAEIRAELFSYMRQYYPEVIKDFGDGQGGTVLTELCAATGEILGFHNDRLFQETQLNDAQQRESLFGIAANNSLKVPNKKPSVTICEFSVTVPPLGDGFDPSYAPIVLAGAKVQGGGKTFETANDIDFNSPYSSTGALNRIFIPTLDDFGRVVSYRITKQEIVYNGVTKVFRKLLTVNDTKPFLKVVVPDKDILEISRVIVKSGFPTVDPSDSDYEDESLRYYEVEALPQRIIFTDSPIVEGEEGRAGIWKTITRKFIHEYTSKGFTTLTFGGGNGDLDAFGDAMSSQELDGSFDELEAYLHTTALGETLPPNSTLYIKYRSGGGVDSNVGAGILTQTDQVRMTMEGQDPAVRRIVERSLSVNNLIPAFGGRNAPTNDEIRYLVKYNNAAQGRCVTLNDYVSRVYQMPGRYGSPFKVTTFKEFNKVVVAILGLDQNAKLSNTSISILQENIAEYLSGYRMMNDYVEVRNGRVYDLGVDVKVLAEDSVQTSEIINNVAVAIAEYFDIYKMEMNQDVMTGRLYEAVNNVPGVLNINSFKIYNKIGNGYSLNEVDMPLIDQETRLINIKDGILYNTTDGMFQVREPLRDIRVTVERHKPGRNRNQD